MRKATLNTQSEIAARKKNDTKPLSFDQLAQGYEFPITNFTLDAALISKYVQAVAIGSEPQKSEYVPPLAITAYSLKGLTGSVTLPAGSIHAAQEVNFNKMVPVGTEVQCRARVAQKVDRGRIRMLIVEFDVLDKNQEKVLSGKTTLILPGKNE